MTTNIMGCSSRGHTHMQPKLWMEV